MVDPLKIAVTRQINKETNAFESHNGIEIVNSRPLRVGIDLSNVCNVNCIFCLAKGGRKKRSDPDAFRSADWIDHLSTLLPFMQRAIFSSFEAIIAPEFPQAVEKVRRSYTPFNIFTNGLALTPEMSKFCLENGLASMNCSFHAADKTTYHGIMRGSDYDTVLANLMHLKFLARKINPDFHLTMVFCAMRRNIKQLPAYVDLAYAVGAKAIQVNYLLVTDEDTGLEHESMFFHQHLYDRNIHIAKAKATQLGIKLLHQPTFGDFQAQSGALAPCYRPWEHLIVTRDGDVSICCGGTSNQGNIFEKDFFSVWNSETFQTFRRRVNSDNPPKVCRSCTRGRENPLDPRTHLTYLRRFPNVEQQRRLRDIVDGFEKGRKVVLPDAETEHAPCAL
ncbi:radical SAM/SPASM domain-containing protein [Paucidesulfovibrio longus]|uniref:radical SAM/SPASM domain-containing protein n=1 Tax=Paucidesulfovibrio longus TaxID=889 RepID=UPI0003B58F4D|nr:radical SAM protein [Paucidesulfovibrio longus]